MLRQLFILAAGLLACACHRDPSPSASSSSSAVAAAESAPRAAAAAAKSSGDSACSTEFDYLVGPQQFGDGDLFRAIVVDDGQVYYRNMSDVYRVPLAGGKPVVLSKGPQLSLDGRAALWVAGDRLLTQSPNDPIFLASPKAGGPWTTIIDLSKEKLGGSRSLVSRVLGGRTAASAGRAVFDGQSFYWIEDKRAKGKQPLGSSEIRTVSLASAEARTLLESPNELSGLGKAGDHLVFIRKDPAPPEVKGAPVNPMKSSNGGAKVLMSMPLSGGEPQALAKIGNIFGGELLTADGTTVYVTGYEDEDLTKPGVYRVSALGGSKLERIDTRVVNGQGFVYDGGLAFVGSSTLEARALGAPATQAKVVLTGPHNAEKLVRTACIVGSYTMHAFAVSGKTLLISLFRTEGRAAGIIRVALP